MRLVKSAAASVVVALAAFTASADEPYSSDGWRITVPSGWEPFQPSRAGARDMSSMLASFESIRSSRGSFTKAKADAAVCVPAILTSFNSVETKGSTLDELVDESNRVSAPLRWELDRSRARISSEQSIDGGEAGKLLAISIVNFGRHGVARLECYCRPDEAAATRAEFARVSDSFRWDAGHEYRERTFFESVDWLKVAFGVAGVLVLALIRAVRSDVSGSRPAAKLRTRRLPRTGTGSARRRS